MFRRIRKVWAKIKPYIVAEEEETFCIKTKNFRFSGNFTDPEAMILLRECIYRNCDRYGYDCYGELADKEYDCEPCDVPSGTIDLTRERSAL